MKDDGPHMGVCTDRDEAGIARFVDAAYAAALSPSLWPDVLARLAGLYPAGFADVFTRSRDGDHACGLAHGLDAADYDGQFLGHWRKRNVWRNARPVKVAGEVSSTRSLVDVGALKRSEIYDGYLQPRGLHEGLRLSLLADEGEVQVVSILRPWSRGAFEAREVALGRTLLPHLRRAAAITRHLHGLDIETEVARCGGGAVFAFDAAGRPFWFNEAAEAALADGALLRLQGGDLVGATPIVTAQIHTAVARAIGSAGSGRVGGAVQLRSAKGAASRNAIVLPVTDRGAWSRCRPPAALMILRQPPAALDCRTRLAEAFDLTEAEADLAARLLDGGAMHAIAGELGRSINTLRTHLYHLMSKTGTRRQVDLVRLLEDAVVGRSRPEVAEIRESWARPFAPCRPPVQPPAMPVDWR